MAGGDKFRTHFEGLDRQTTLAERRHQAKAIVVLPTLLCVPAIMKVFIVMRYFCP